jgi:uncharacterized protein
MKVIVSIYRSPKKEGMYLYVDKREGLERVPEPLLKQFGEAELAMTLLLTPERKLARVEAPKVLEAIGEQGFFLQMPPSTFEAKS